LPPPPPGRSGWPWTEEWPPDAETLPRITVITPSFRQAQFIEQTIRSVLLSGYPDLEYFVLDGGSTDGTREIIEKYSPWLAGWRCEKDAGQSAAINEGWTKATGDVLSWINSDDWYHPGALVAAGRRFAADPAVMWVSGAVDDVDVEGVFHKRHPAAATPLACALGRKDYGYFQPGMFWRRALVEKVGSLDVKLNCAFDQDFWLRSLLAGYVLTPLPEPVACFRVHGASKTGGLSPKVIAEDWAMFATAIVSPLPNAARLKRGSRNTKPAIWSMRHTLSYRPENVGKPWRICSAKFASHPGFTPIAYGGGLFFAR
jgi:glycosyltransferase involved in cell wall biosynthesis